MQHWQGFSGFLLKICGIRGICVRLHKTFSLSLTANHFSPKEGKVLQQMIFLYCDKRFVHGFYTQLLEDA